MTEGRTGIDDTISGKVNEEKEEEESEDTEETEKDE